MVGVLRVGSTLDWILDAVCCGRRGDFFCLWFFLFFRSGFFILERRANLSTEKFDNGRNPVHPSNEHTSNGKRTCHRSAAH